MTNAIGKWAFLIGVLIAIFSGLLYSESAYSWTIIIIALGLIVGFLNIHEKEAEKFLIATVALLIIGTVSVNSLFASGSFAGQIQAILNNFISFVSCAALVVALKTVITLGSNEDDKKK